MRTLGVTAGCPLGIGPEVTARALASAQLDDASVACAFFGPCALLLEGAALARVEAVARDDGVVCGGRFVSCVYDADTSDALRFQRDALLAAAEAARAGSVDALVTGPLRKRALAFDDGRAFPGQTELLHELLAADDEEPLMCFAGAPFVLGLLTVHVPLALVSARVTQARVALCLRRLHDAAARILAVEEPRLVVLGVNPHAGEGGLCGDEEQRVLEPALAAARARGLVVEGPLPADGFFASVKRRAPEALPHGVLAMHHDQGLAPYKLLATSVNVTWGLRVPRTSPDHGTADDIAGKGVADASSMTAALELAARLAVGQ